MARSLQKSVGTHRNVGSADSESSDRACMHMASAYSAAPSDRRSSLNRKYSPPREERVLGRRTTVSLECARMMALLEACVSVEMVGRESTP